MLRVSAVDDGFKVELDLVDVLSVSTLPTINSCIITLLAVLRFLQWRRRAARASESDAE